MIVCYFADWVVILKLAHSSSIVKVPKVKYSTWNMLTLGFLIEMQDVADFCEEVKKYLENNLSHNSQEFNEKFKILQILKVCNRVILGYRVSNQVFKMSIICKVCKRIL